MRIDLMGWSLFAAAYAVLLLVVLRQGEDSLVQYLPDDAFYYLKLARNYAELGRWTFDGTASATGFHLLWAYSIAAIYALAPPINVTTIYVVLAAISIGAYAGAALLLSRLVSRLHGEGAAWAVYFVLLGTGAVSIPTLGMESSLVVLFSTCAFVAVFAPSRNSVGIRVLACATAGLLGMLARSDFGLLAASIFLVQLLRFRSRWRELLPSAALLAGAVLGLMLVLLHSWAISGDVLQNSAQMKAHWSSLAGNPITVPLRFLATGILPVESGSPLAAVPYYRYLALALLLALAAASLWASSRAPAVAAPASAALLTIILYLLFYSRNSSALQIWYLATFAAPLGVLLAPVAAAAARHRPAVVALVVAASATLSVYAATRPPWPHQQAMRDAGRFLAAYPDLKAPAAWNAGIIGFFAGRPVVNLDGLVNDDVLPHAKHGTLARYVGDRGITHVVDFAAMFDAPAARRGGYADGRLRACLEPRRDFSAGQAARRMSSTDLLLYAVNPACLRDGA